MSLIEVEGLTRRFEVALRPPGLWGALKGVFRPEFRTVEAVKGIGFSVAEGEMLAFIGPNGAGKSTTIKMLTGILHPTAGRARVAGLVPWESREELSYRIGSVFGTRSQLWYHLPAEESFRVLAALYDLPDATFRARRREVADLFDLEPLLPIPVRKLSLGQRMRCELAACLLHRPKVLFLDEPTIGLDVVAKRTMRELIQRMNREEGLTIFLTSHDAGDIEQLCKRTILINHGAVVLDERTQVLRHRHFHTKVLSLRLRTPAEGFAMDGVLVRKQKGPGLKLEVDTRVASVEAVLARLLAAHGIEDITIKDPPLEDVIASLYAAERPGAAAPAGRPGSGGDAQAQAEAGDGE